MRITVDGNNFFHTGWLTRFQGLPRILPGSAAIKSGDLAAFYAGWDMCDETPEDGYPNRLTAYYAMLMAKQAVAVWIDDDGNDIA